MENIQQKYLFKSISEGKAEIKIEGNKLSIIRSGLISKLSHGFSGEKTILINQITGIQLKEVGFTRGYIQFIVSGREERRSGVLKGTTDENIIYFDNYGKKQNEIMNKNAKEIKTYIENYNSIQQNNSNVVINQEDKYDKLKKIKELFDSGVITQEEFDKEKEKILN